MKFALALLVAASAHAALLTSATCLVTGQTSGVIFTANDPNSCASNASSPSNPLAPGYRVFAEATQSRVSTRALAGNWSSASDRATVRSVATSDFTDTVLFPGSGMATLRVTLASQLESIDFTGVYMYSVDGVVKSANIGPIGAGLVLTQRDYQIQLGNSMAIRKLAISYGNANASDLLDVNSMTFGVFQYRLYDATGAQLNGVSATGASGELYRSVFAPGDTSTGPVLTADAAIPEPTTSKLLLAGTLSGILLKYARSSSHRALVQLDAAIEPRLR